MQSLNQWFTCQPIWLKAIAGIMFLVVVIPCMVLAIAYLSDLTRPCTATFTKEQGLVTEPNGQVFLSLSPVPRGTHPVLARTRDGWVQVEVDGQPGWVYAHSANFVETQGGCIGVPIVE